MSYFDNTYILDSCDLSNLRLSINLINAITPSGPVAVGIMAVFRKDSILKSDFEKINNKADIYAKTTLVTMGNYDKDVLNMTNRKFNKEIRSLYDLDKNDYSLGILIMTPKIKYIYKYGKNLRIVKNKGLMIYTDNILNNMDLRSVKRLVKTDCLKKDRYAKELTDRCRSRGEKDDMGIICICPKVRKGTINWLRWTWQGL